MARIQFSVGSRARNLDADVTTIQNLINRHAVALVPIPPLTVDGDCGQKTIQAIRRFQDRVVGMAHPDGRVDPDGGTLAALNGPPSEQAVPRYHYPAGPQEPLIEIARPYIGATEAAGNRMGTDPRMREIFECDWLSNDGATDGYPWCCAFVSLCTQKLIRQHPMFFGHLSLPRTAGVTNFRTRWAVQNDCLIFPPNDGRHVPHRGDVVVFTFSHIGIVDTVADGSVTTIEGNTNAAGSREGTTVRGKTREFGVIRCFIRFPIPIEYDVENQMCRVPPESALLSEPAH